MNLLFYRGSAKNIYSTSSPQELLFEFKDEYSLFDWGKMPDKIPYKGKSLAYITYLLFDYLQEHKICHHGIALDKNEMWKVRKAINFEYDPLFPYEQYHKKIADTSNSNKESYFIPLEMVFRCGVPKGSSLLQRSLQKSLTQSNELNYVEGQQFNTPIIEFSTKHELVDRYLDNQEAQEISGLSNEKWNELIQLGLKVAKSLRHLFSECGLELWDGKMEWAYTPCGGKFLLVDALGPDELRLSFQNTSYSLSKQFLRNYYKKTDWYKALDKYKSEKTKNNSKLPKGWQHDFLEQNKLVVPSATRKTLETASQIYQFITNTLSMHLKQEKVFPQAINKDELIDLLQNQE